MTTSTNDTSTIAMDSKITRLKDSWGYIHELETNVALADTTNGVFLPPQVRYLSAATTVLEIPPRKMTIHKAEELTAEFQIPTPWMIYIIDSASTQMSIFARPSQLHSLDDPVFHAAYLSNIKQDGHQCGSRMWGPHTHIHLKEPSQIQRAFAIVNRFWLSSFNGGMYYSKANYQHMIPPEAAKHIEYRLYDIWPQNWIEYLEWLSTQSPVDLCGWGWVQAGTLSTCIKEASHSAYECLVARTKTLGHTTTTQPSKESKQAAIEPTKAW